MLKCFVDALLLGDSRRFDDGADGLGTGLEASTLDGRGGETGERASVAISRRCGGISWLSAPAPERGRKFDEE